MTGFANPGTIGRLDVEKFNATESLDLSWSIYHTTVVKGLQLDEFTVEQVWYDSKDGTKVPMFIVRHKSTKTDGSAPAIQYGELWMVFQRRVNAERRATQATAGLASR